MLAEVLIALAIAGAVGAVMLMMLQAFVVSCDPRFGIRERVVERQVAILRVAGAIRSAAAVMGSTDDSLVLWDGDANLDGTPNLTELRLVTYDEQASEVRCYGPGEGPAAEAPLPTNEDFVAMMESLASAESLPVSVVLTGVSSWEVRFDTSDPRAARTLRVRVGTETETGIDAPTVVASLQCVRRP